MFSYDTEQRKTQSKPDKKDADTQPFFSEAPQIQRQSDEDKPSPKINLKSELKNNGLFKKLPQAAQDKILEEIDKAPETITKAILNKIIDSVAPPEYREGLKKAGEGIIQKIFHQTPPSTSKCDAIPGYHEGTSTSYKGQCCRGTTESAQDCCPKERFAPNESFSNCCKPGEVVDANGKCMKPEAPDFNQICVSPGKKDALGHCCMPPLQVIEGICQAPPQKEEPKPSPFSLSFTLDVIDDYNIDDPVLNTRQKPRFEEVKNKIHQFMEACPASSITLTGHADKPGTEEHNQDLGQRRADHIKLLLQLDLIKINFGGVGPLIFARSAGENDPVDKAAGESYSSKNRRVEIEFHSMCPALNAPMSPEKTFFDFSKQ